MRRFLVLFLITISVVSAQGNKLLLSEIMFYPSEVNGEFIEVFNPSDSNTVDLSNISVKYHTSNQEKFIIVRGGVLLAPKGIAVILEGNYDFINGAYIQMIPNNAIILKLSDNSFGSNGMANTTDREIYLIEKNVIIDSSIYTADNSAGYSDERKLCDDYSQWKNSTQINGTPGLPYQRDALPISYTYNSLVVNEIMYNPSLNEPEWFEVYNRSNDSINISCWEVSDLLSKPVKKKLIQENLFIQQKEYFVIAKDSSFLKCHSEFSGNIIITSFSSLNNDKDGIVLYDATGKTIDSVYYEDKAQLKGKSIERIDPDNNSNARDNWSSSLDISGSTPGKINSIFTYVDLLEEKFAKSEISLSPNPFSPDGDGFEDDLNIQFSLSEPVSGINISIYNSRGILVKELVNNYSIAKNGFLNYDGKDKDGNPIKMGIYLMYIETTGIFNYTKKSFTIPFVSARKL
ncbi:MAG: lamin tail domain-containing protein [Melioribacteraceae bacterium]|nr:lamin tail domain-containing protein [Melioribacteraceae bacterium]